MFQVSLYSLYWRKGIKPLVFDVFFLIQRTFYCPIWFRSEVGVFLIKTIIKTRFVQAFRVDSGKRKQKIIECRVSKFNYNRLVLVNIASRNPSNLEQNLQDECLVTRAATCFVKFCDFESYYQKERDLVLSSYFFSCSGHPFAFISHSFGISILWELLIIQNTFDYKYCD